MMTKLTDMQALILRTASHHPDGLAAPSPNLPPAARGAVAESLLSAGLVDAVRDAQGHDASVTWKLDGEAMVLRITDAGLAEIGLPQAAHQRTPAQLRSASQP